MNDLIFLDPSEPAYAKAIAEDSAKTYQAIQAITINPFDGGWNDDSAIRVYGPDRIEGTGWKASIDKARDVTISGQIDHEDLRLLADFARDVGEGFLGHDWCPQRDWGVPEQMEAAMVAMIDAHTDTVLPKMKPLPPGKKKTPKKKKP